MLTVIGALALAGCAASDDPEPAPEPAPESAPPGSSRPGSSSASRTPAPTDPLSGAGTVSDHPVVAVKIDNTAAARPQIGLDRADHVWVQEVEAGITRLVAVFHTTLPRQVGPVRSARSTDVELLPLYGRPLLVYSGANRDVTAQLDRAGFPADSGGTGFTRVPSRSAPYDLVVDLETVTTGHRLTRPRPLGLAFAAADADWAAAKARRATTVTVGADRLAFSWSDGRYRVEPQGTTTDNVVIMTVENVADGNADVNGARSVRSRTVGSGKVVVHREGRTRTGTWSRASTSVGLVLADLAGTPLTLAPGRTWFLLQG